MTIDKPAKELEDFKKELAEQGFGHVSDRMAEALLSVHHWLDGEHTLH